MKDEEIKFVSGIIIGMVLLPMILVSILPGWFAIFGDWGNYLYWMPISITVSRIVYFLTFIAYPIASIRYKKYSYLFALIYNVILAIWGLPILQDCLTKIVTTELEGLELQQTILRIIVIESFSIMASLTTKVEDKEVKERKEVD
ncbi:MAG: hypothetical protein ACTSRS_21970 [Candidatus Helarchaeota archaeon]